MLLVAHRKTSGLVAFAICASIGVHALCYGSSVQAEAKTMRAVTASDFGLPGKVLQLQEVAWPIPSDGKLLIHTIACSLSPGDWRMLSGDAAIAKYPTDGFPYIPGLDVCGQVARAAGTFSVGDWVVATWSGPFGTGGLAEYSVIDPATTAHKPDMVDCVDAAALANSAGHALMALRAARVQAGDRVLVIGGSGGVGTAAVQLARTEFAADFVAATSSDTALLASLGVERPIDYTREEWWSLQEFKDAPFDVVIDLAEGVAAWRRVQGVDSVLKKGGRFLAVVLNEWHIQATQWWHIPALLLPPLGRQLSSLFGRVHYSMYLGTLDSSVLNEVLHLAEAGRLRAVIDPAGPFGFTSEGAVAAFDLLRSRHAKGKVVVAIGQSIEQ